MRSFGMIRYLLTPVEAAALFISTGCGTGLLASKEGKGGGTISSIVTAMVQAVLISQGALSLKLAVVISFVTLVLGLLFVPMAEAAIRRAPPEERKRHTGEVVTHDFNQTTIDEVHGQFLAVLPVCWLAHTWVVPRWLVDMGFDPMWLVLLLIAVSCAHFRFFDIAKLPPVKWAEENLDGAYGVMIDDSIAGLQAALLMLVLLVEPRTWFAIVLFGGLVYWWQKRRQRKA